MVEARCKLNRSLCTHPVSHIAATLTRLHWEFRKSTAPSQTSCRAGNAEASRIAGVLQYRSLDWRDV